jgi:hypothetical protein
MSRQVRRIVIAIALLASCARSSPTAVVRALATAARDGDRRQVAALLGPRTRGRLEADARIASEQAGRRRLGPEDLLAVGWAPATEEIESIDEVERSGDHAVVEVVSRRGARERIEVVRDHGAWRVELP